jgi:hypothetical protein
MIAHLMTAFVCTADLRSILPLSKAQRRAPVICNCMPPVLPLQENTCGCDHCDRVCGFD